LERPPEGKLLAWAAPGILRRGRASPIEGVGKSVAIVLSNEKKLA